ncbi:helix-turn-helix domain-containing protein [Marinomonas algicola]|jgi:DNA-binding protein Fis|uniref:helix-turn-helix domain-containing protein n=1 Tax=Marinomonas algicola TaxID=2773454 RepID=UPI0017489514|nr:helix-turn-helix domain-containing protein [Marinomonas algicola]
MKALIYGLTASEERDVTLLLNFIGVGIIAGDNIADDPNFVIIGSLNDFYINSLIPVICLRSSDEVNLSAPTSWYLPLPWQYEELKPILQKISRLSKLPAINAVDLNLHVKRLESLLIRQALLVANGVVSKAAQNLQIQRTTLIEKMRRYNIDKSEF